MWLGRIAIQPPGLVNCEELGMADGAPSDGMLGMDVLQQLVLEVDFDVGKIRILKSADPTGAERISLQRHYANLPLVRAAVCDAMADEFLIDTGAAGDGAGALAGPTFDRLRAKGRITIIGEADFSSGARKSTTPIARAARMSLGENVHEQPIFLRSPIPIGILGLDFWSRYVVTFDFPNNALYLRRGKEFNRRDSFNGSGLHLRRVGQNTIVERVAEDSPAQKTGVLPDDELIAIDGEHVSELPVRDVERRFHAEGKMFRLSLRRRGADLQVTLTTGSEAERIARRTPHDANVKDAGAPARPAAAKKLKD